MVSAHPPRDKKNVVAPPDAESRKHDRSVFIFCSFVLPSHAKSSLAKSIGVGLSDSARKARKARNQGRSQSETVAAGCFTSATQRTATYRTVPVECSCAGSPRPVTSQPLGTSNQNQEQARYRYQSQSWIPPSKIPCSLASQPQPRCIQYVNLALAPDQPAGAVDAVDAVDAHSLSPFPVFFFSLLRLGATLVVIPPSHRIKFFLFYSVPSHTRRQLPPIAEHLFVWLTFAD